MAAWRNAPKIICTFSFYQTMLKIVDQQAAVTAVRVADV
jgi:hypothetical protein